MGRIRRLVLDVLKPHRPTMLVLADLLAEIKGVYGVDLTLYEIDNKVENIKITLEGESIPFEDVERVIEENGGTIHSIDKVTAGATMIEEVETSQDVGYTLSR